jgi:hypothetical protein
MKRPFPLVIVWWGDAVVHTGQHSIAEAKTFGPRPRQTVGWLLSQDKEGVRIAMDYDPPVPLDGEGVGHVTVIPTGMMTKIEKVMS